MSRADCKGSNRFGNGSAGQTRNLHELERHLGDFSLGTLRIHTRRSSAGHNGIESIINALGTKDFLRIRIGVAPDHKVEDGMSYLLAPLRKAQLKVVDEMLDVAADAVKTMLTDGAAAAMNRFNRKVETEKD